MENDFRSLKLLDHLQFVFRKLGINYPVMRKILEMKLTMDQRRVPTIFSGNASEKKEGNQFVKSLWIYALYGIILIFFIFIGDNYMFQLGIIFGISMFILMTSLISDFSTVLLDVRDKTILHTKPVDDRTINAAKIVHLTLYMLMMTGAFLGIPAIVMLIYHGVGYFLLFLVSTVWMILFIIALTALVYIFILRHFNGDKLQDIINYVQIILSICLVIGYQVAIRVFDFVDLDIVYHFSWWHVFLPPIWFAAPFELILHHNTAVSTIVLSIIALLLPLIAIYLYYRLMPAFERNLEKLLDQTAMGKEKKRPFVAMWEKLLCRSNVERAYFRLAYILMGEERDFKLKVYPSLGIAMVFPFIFIFSQTQSFAEVSKGNGYFNIYLALLFIGVTVSMLRFSSKYKAAWILHAAPVEDVTKSYSAALKAMLIKLLLPIFMLIAVVFILIFSVRIIPDMLIVGTVAVPQTLISYKLLKGEDFPFSEKFEATS
ncbi:hypothetical protein P5G51_001970 [Virgibacillus sp. 179-BFC.A HS]|uniref:ABC transporter permease n=1 Tax=Tigheibacillus jepli TaxID=3035914 RepID=A0ABU5CDD2_9BACI|nr:hypothetical protein [Virgibacillus sp. 179-BFC.A HS]MDY0404343.1 hypothetical protein [Virgibacillus sp. 179-BFC.A HS]